MTIRVLKWDVPVDDQVHYIGEGEIIHVACQYDANSVQVWTEEVAESWEAVSQNRCVQVVGTGHEYPTNNVNGETGHWHAVGTALALNGALVWHLLKWIQCRGGCEPTGYIKGSFTTCTREEEHAG